VVAVSKEEGSKTSLFLFSLFVFLFFELDLVFQSDFLYFDYF
jgi:hypothetical protein